MVNERSTPYSGELISVGPANIVLRCNSMYGIQGLKFRRDEIGVVCVELGYDLNKSGMCAEVTSHLRCTEELKPTR